MAIGAKLVSPPLFQSMYSRVSHSCAGTTKLASASGRNPLVESSRIASRGCGVNRGMDTDQCSLVGQKLMGEVYGTRRTGVFRRRSAIPTPCDP
uniref:Unannotated protein n=1 Tax=freshwater metagenome TaxID=449393 RepID=A0A6J7NXH6_9ZZZZ